MEEYRSSKTIVYTPFTPFTPFTPKLAEVELVIICHHPFHCVCWCCLQAPVCVLSPLRPGVAPPSVFRRPFGALLRCPLRRGCTPACALTPLRGLPVLCAGSAPLTILWLPFGA